MFTVAYDLIIHQNCRVVAVTFLTSHYNDLTITSTELKHNGNIAAGGDNANYQIEQFQIPTNRLCD